MADEADSMLRTCKHCNVVKPLAEFRKDRQRRTWQCKKCRSEARKAAYREERGGLVRRPKAVDEAERKARKREAYLRYVIREDWRADYKDYGTVEGRLTAIQEQGTLQLLLKDEWLKQTIRCYVPEDQLPDAFANFRHRVEVSGVIHYRRNGTPISVEVEAIEPLPDDSELPSSNDVRGLLAAG